MDDACRQAQELIPWVLNGTADCEDEHHLHGHTVECADCRRDLARASVLRHRVGEFVAALPSMPADGRLKLERGLGAQTESGSAAAIEKVLVVMEVLGLPEVITGIVKTVIDASAGDSGLRLELPFIPSVELGT